MIEPAPLHVVVKLGDARGRVDAEEFDGDARHPVPVAEEGVRHPVELRGAATPPGQKTSWR
jgi:hypothetical protein